MNAQVLQLPLHPNLLALLYSRLPSKSSLRWCLLHRLLPTPRGPLPDRLQLALLGRGEALGREAEQLRGSLLEPGDGGGEPGVGIKLVER